MKTIDRRPDITAHTILESIKATEAWSQQLDTLIIQGQPVMDVLSGATKLYNQLEIAAQNPQAQLPHTSDKAKRIKALWAHSAPGTYYQASKNDRFKDKSWARWMDRRRINHAFQVARNLAKISSRQNLTGNWAHDQELLKEHAPLVIYNGRADESAALSYALKVPWLRIPDGLTFPAEKAYVVHPLEGLNHQMSTVDAIRNFRLPKELRIEVGDEIGIVAHAPQLVRVLYLLANFKEVIPAGINIRAFPLPTPITGYPEYPIQELRGIVFYRFIAYPPIAADQPLLRRS